MEEELSMGW